MNPYEVLGVSENADEETIKRAYKELVKKYHPDKYVNNPLADLAAEKMKEINKAYDMLTKTNTSSGGNYGGYNGGYNTGGFGGYGGYQNATPTFSMVRQLLSMRQCTQALMMLERLPKTAEWYYLSGLANIQRGWHTQGIQHLEQAARMDPDNAEYRDTLFNVRNRSTSYSTGGGYMPGGIDCCPLPCWCIPCFCPCDGCCC
jgi:curved DNA-binding protein CbpA